MEKRFVARWLLGLGGEDALYANSLDGLKKFVTTRIPATQNSPGGRSLCVADLKSKSKFTPWLWQMEAGGKVTIGKGKYAKKAERLFSDGMTC